MRPLIGLLLCAAVSAQAHHRTENLALLGIVAAPVPTTAETEGKAGKVRVRLAHVLKKSPAAKAGLKVGDLLVSIAGRRVTKPAEVDAALAGYRGGEQVDVVVEHDGKETTLKAKLIRRRDYKGEFLKKQTRGKTGFKAPEWFVYEWSQTGDEPPTRKNTKGKVVVLHCFQGW